MVGDGHLTNRPGLYTGMPALIKTQYGHCGLHVQSGRPRTEILKNLLIGNSHFHTVRHTYMYMEVVKPQHMTLTQTRIQTNIECSNNHCEGGLARGIDCLVKSAMVRRLRI